MASAHGPGKQADPAATGPYTLRPLISDVPLSADGESSDVRITCVEVLGVYAFVNAAIRACFKCRLELHT